MARVRERAAAFIVARGNSSRLPQKHFRRIGDRLLLDWIIDQIKTSRELDEIVIATVAEPINQPLREYAKEKQVSCFWYQGDPNAVTTRLRRAAECYGAEICVLVSGDCPLIYAPAVDEMIQALRQEPGADFISVASPDNGTEALLEGIQVARRRAWELADELSTTPELKEHQFPIMRLLPEAFKGLSLKLSGELYGVKHRLSVDTYADVEFMNQVWETLTRQGRPFDLPEVVKLLGEKPGLRDLNRHVHQRALVERSVKVLFVLDVGGGFGYGHLGRAQELGLQLVERLGWPVTFVVDDESARKQLTTFGFHTAWGAWGRSACRCPTESQAKAFVELMAQHDLLIMDVRAENAAAGWRRHYCPDKPVVVLDNFSRWVGEADLLVFPGVTGPMAVSQSWATQGSTEGGASGPEIIGGLGLVILPRQIQRLASSDQVKKDLDILACVEFPEERREIEKVLRSHKLRGHLIQEPCPELPGWLARARVYVGKFSPRFYEALALGAFPVVWPGDEADGVQVGEFYYRLGLPQVWGETGGKLEDLLGGWAKRLTGRVRLKDGTPQIVQAISEAVRKFAEQEEMRGCLPSRPVIGDYFRLEGGGK